MMDHLIYKNFEGAPSRVIPEIISQGYYPYSTKQLLEKRLEVYNSSANNSEKNFWLETPFVTGDICIYHKDRRMKILTDASEIRSVLLDLKGMINPDGSMKIYGKLFEDLKGREFTRYDDKKYATRQSLEHKDIITNPYWVTLVDGDKALLSEYAQIIIDSSKKKRSERVMGVIALDALKPEFDLRLCKLHGIYTTQQGLAYESDIEMQQKISSEKTNILAYKIEIAKQESNQTKRTKNSKIISMRI
ncbi:MAG TPA: hypothetical protein VEC16_01670 [Alphaproteobacteria bacterium]|nr:hypothetical protein [Alphaproteobacteria bacterium]